MSKILRWTPWLALLVLLGWMAQADAAVRMPSLFADHMVLQQNKPVPVWGWADPNEQVTVKMDAQLATATADANGNWKTAMGPLKAGGPYTLTVSAASGTIAINDVLVGEVWVCSGQSNMQWDVKNSKNFDHEKTVANYPKLRMFSVPRTVKDAPQAECGGTWEVCGPDTVGAFSAVGYFFARKLHQDLKVPVGMIHTSWGGTPAEAWTSMESLKANPLYSDILTRWDEKMANYPTLKAEFDKALPAWEAEKKAAQDQGVPFSKPRPAEPWGPEHSWRPAGLYNAMINPLVPYAITGAIWYQGESNADRAYQYRELFPRMIQDWRAAWGQGDFPFYYVQLANFMARKPEPGESAWAELREAQLKTLALPKTGMAVIIDIGEEKDIHPRNKQDVGKRLALLALHNDYKRNTKCFSPIACGSARCKEGTQFVVRFAKHTGGLTTSDGKEVRGFQIAGPDRQFVWAKAKIKYNRVVVWSPEVKDPVAVRYAWADNPDCNLINRAKLPASPFRTDDWPGITAEKK